MLPSVSERFPFAKLRHFGDFAYFAVSTPEFRMKAFENWLHFTKWENDLKSIFIRVIREIRGKTRFQRKDAKIAQSKAGLKSWAAVLCTPSS